MSENGAEFTLLAENEALKEGKAMTSEEALAKELDKEPQHIREMLIRRSLRMIFETEVNQADEILFNDWRRSHGLKPLDENNEELKEGQ